LIRGAQRQFCCTHTLLHSHNAGYLRSKTLQLCLEKSPVRRMSRIVCAAALPPIMAVWIPSPARWRSLNAVNGTASGAHLRHESSSSLPLSSSSPAAAAAVTPGTCRGVMAHDTTPKREARQVGRGTWCA